MIGFEMWSKYAHNIQYPLMHPRHSGLSE